MMTVREGFVNSEKSIYGLNQSLRCWNKRIEKFLLTLDFQLSQEEPCMFFKVKSREKIILALYIDDGLISNNK